MAVMQQMQLKVLLCSAVTEPHSSGLGGGGATLTYNGKDGEVPKMYEYKTMSSYNYKQGDKIGVPGVRVHGVKWMRRKSLTTSFL